MNTTRSYKLLVTDWLTEKAYRGLTLTQYGNIINRWHDWLLWNGRNPSNPSTQDILDYMADMSHRDKSKYTINARLNAIKQFYRWLAEKGDYANIAENVHTMRQKKFYNKRPLRDAEVRQLLNSIDTRTPTGRRDYCIILLMLFCGLRACEVSRANFGDRDGHILQVQRKGHFTKDKSVTMPPEVLKAWRDYESNIDKRGRILAPTPQDPAFTTYYRATIKSGFVDRLKPIEVSKIVKKRLLAAGLNDRRLTGHSLRYTFGTMLVKNGTSLEDVRELLGHTSVGMTEIYTKFAQDQRLEENPPANKIAAIFLSEN